MSSEIKFRVWDKHHRNISKVTSLQLGADWIVNGGLSTWREEDGVLMRYTGRHDCNGKAIYEGDLITYADINDELCTSEVFWDGEFAGFNPWAMSSGITGVVVIGNVYESPELLESAA